MLIVLAKLGTSEMVGQFALGFATTAPIFMFSNLQLRTVLATDARREYVFADYLELRLLMSSLALLAIAVIILLGGFSFETGLIICVVGAAKAIESVSDIFYGLLQHHQRMDRIAISLMIKGPLSLMVFGVAVVSTGSLVWGVAGLLTSWIVVLFIWDLPSGIWIMRRSAKKDGIHPRLSFSSLRKLWILSLPMGVVMMLISLNVNIPRYFVEHYMGEHELGIFAALAYLMLTGDMVVNALGQSASPRLARDYADGMIKAYRSLLGRLVAIGFILGAIGVLLALTVGRQMLSLLYSPEYGEHYGLLVMLMVVAALTYISSFMGYGMTAARFFRVQTPLFALITGTSAAACVWLVPRYGLMGAASSMLIAVIVQLVGSSSICIYVIFKKKELIQKHG